MRAIVVGAVESTRVALRAVAAAPGWRLAGLVTLPADLLAARHSDAADLGAEAGALGARVVRAADGNAPEALRALRDLAPDRVLVVGWSQICRPAFLEAAGPGGVVGYHPAPLPRLRGRAAIPWTILLDEKITASTLFWIEDEGVDSGPVLAQRFFHVAPDETAGSLYGKHMAALAALLAEEALPRLAAGAPPPPRRAQDERCATWCAKRTPEDGRVDWARPAAEVWRLVRAVGRPYPGAFTGAGGRRLVLWEAAPWPEGGGAARRAAAPGQVVARDAASFAVRCGDGLDLRVTGFAWADGGAPGGQGPPRLHARLGGG